MTEQQQMRSFLRFGASRDDEVVQVDTNEAHGVVTRRGDHDYEEIDQPDYRQLPAPGL
jgi:hypothetical protein